MGARLHGEREERARDYCASCTGHRKGEGSVYRGGLRGVSFYITLPYRLD